MPYDIKSTEHILFALVKVKDRIMYFVVNISPPERFDVATSNLAGE